MTLKELRKSKHLTQAKCADYLGIPLRTYQNYETDPRKKGSMKYAFMLQKLEHYGYIDENHGILTIPQIQAVCTPLLQEANANYCYLFGSYAKGKATPSSDVDLLVSTSLTGLRFFEFVEALREALKKKVDVLKSEQLNENPELINEILKDGVKIYG